MQDALPPDELDVTTGENVASADLKVARYAVRVEDGWVCVSLG